MKNMVVRHLYLVGKRKKERVIVILRNGSDDKPNNMAAVVRDPSLVQPDYGRYHSGHCLMAPTIALPLKIYPVVQEEHSEAAIIWTSVVLDTELLYLARSTTKSKVETHY